MDPEFPYPLAFQTTLPDDFKENRDFRSRLSGFSRAGLWGLELNISAPERVQFSRVEQTLREHGLELSMFASGLTAKLSDLSLSATEEPARRRAVEACRRFLAWPERDDVGVIAGFLKGIDRSDPTRARDQLRRSLDELAPVAEREQTPFILEATNRHETPVAHSIRDARDLVAPYPAKWMRILPDTFHMNIEEADLAKALKDCVERFSSVHFSENNRCLPGFGDFDFARILCSLCRIGYSGRIGLEGNLCEDEVTDVGRAVEYLRSIWADIQDSPESSPPR